MGLFEIHFHDSEFKPSLNVGPDSVGGDVAADVLGDEDEESIDDWDDGVDVDDGSALVPAVVGLVVLAAVAIAVKKLLN